MASQTCPYKCKNGRIFNPVTRDYQPCPHCAGVLQALSSATPDDNALDLLDRLCIPTEYRNARFNPETFFEKATYDIFSWATLNPVIEQLSAIESAIISSQILVESCYFYTGGYSHVFEYVYSCLREAVVHGLTAVPYTSLKELCAIRASTSQMMKLYGEITWFDYTTADICFIAATASSDKADACILADLLQERERHGLPTYVMGYWADSALASAKNSMHYLISAESKRLGLLHPYEIVTTARYQGNGSVQDALGVVSSLGITHEKILKPSAGLCGVSLEKYSQAKE